MDMKLEYIRVIRHLEIIRVDVSLAEVSLPPRCCVDELLLIKCNASLVNSENLISARRELSRVSLIEGII